MDTTCIISPHRNAISETFILAHIEFLRGPKVVLNGNYPEYACDSREIRYFYGSNRRLKKLAKLLPHYFYERLISPRALSEKSVHDYIAGFFKAYHVDVILAEYGFSGAEICPHARALRIPLIVHFHGHDAHRLPELGAFQERYRQLFRYAFRIISVSRFMSASLVALGADPARIVYNPYGPREYFYDIKPDFRKTFLAAGRFTDIKGPYLTVLAFKQVLDEVPDASLVMVGDGPLRETCISLAKTWGLGPRVSFPGALRHEQLLPLFAQACCFVQHSVTPSYGDAEGTPVAILEAGAASLPVVSTRHAGIQDVVVHEKTGFLVQERDVQGMANYMRLLIRNKPLCRLMGQDARDHVRANFSMARHIGCLDEVVRTARSESARASGAANTTSRTR